MRSASRPISARTETSGALSRINGSHLNKRCSHTPKRPPTVSAARNPLGTPTRSAEHTSELQSLMRISYAVFYLKNKSTPRMTYSTNQKKRDTKYQHQQQK